MKKVIFLLILAPFFSFAEPYSITLKEVEKNVVYEIISTVGEKGLAMLLFDSVRLIRLESKIQHIHPLQFIGYIVYEPHLNDCLHIISDSYFKWRAFLDGFAPSMQREQDENRLTVELIEEFALYFHVDKEKLLECVQRSDWEAFAREML